MQKLASTKTTFVIVDMLLFSWWCEDDFTQCFHWALSTKKIWSRVINLFIDTSSMHSRTFCKKSTKFINWLLASCFNEDNLVLYYLGKCCLEKAHSNFVCCVFVGFWGKDRDLSIIGRSFMQKFEPMENLTWQ